MPAQKPLTQAFMNALLQTLHNHNLSSSSSQCILEVLLGVNNNNSNPVRQGKNDHLQIIPALHIFLTFMLTPSYVGMRCHACTERNSTTMRDYHFLLVNKNLADLRKGCNKNLNFPSGNVKIQMRDLDGSPALLLTINDSGNIREALPNSKPL